MADDLGVEPLMGHVAALAGRGEMQNGKCAASYKSNHIQGAQLVLTTSGTPGPVPVPVLAQSQI